MPVPAPYKADAAWCAAIGEEASGKRAYGRRLRERGLEQSKGTAIARYWRGIGLPGEPAQYDWALTTTPKPVDSRTKPVYNCEKPFHGLHCGSIRLAEIINCGPL